MNVDNQPQYPHELTLTSKENLNIGISNNDKLTRQRSTSFNFSLGVWVFGSQSAAHLGASIGCHLVLLHLLSHASHQQIFNFFVRTISEVDGLAWHEALQMNDFDVTFGFKRAFCFDGLWLMKKSASLISIDQTTDLSVIKRETDISLSYKACLHHLPSNHLRGRRAVRPLLSLGLLRILAWQSHFA